MNFQYMNQVTYSFCRYVDSFALILIQIMEWKNKKQKIKSRPPTSRNFCLADVKQGFFLPGTHLEIKDPLIINNTKPDYVIILPWNIKDEIMEQLSFIKNWGGRFVIPIPEVIVI